MIECCGMYMFDSQAMLDYESLRTSHRTDLARVTQDHTHELHQLRIDIDLAIRARDDAVKQHDVIKAGWEEMVFAVEYTKKTAADMSVGHERVQEAWDGEKKGWEKERIAMEKKWHESEHEVSGREAADWMYRTIHRSVTMLDDRTSDV